MLTHKQLRYFVDIVDAGSFSLAAERLFIAQSALSRQVKDMEQALQVPLLERGTRHLQATPAGRSLYADARRILADLQQAAVNARDAQRGIEGTVHLLHASSVPLTPALQSFLRRHLAQHPGVSVEVSQSSSEHQAPDIAQARADMGLARAPVLRRYPGMHYEPLYTEGLVVALPPGHALAQAPEIALGDLRGESFVATPHLDRGGLSHHVAQLCRAAGFEPRSARVRSRKWSQLALVQGGFGVAVMPESLAAWAPPGVPVRPLAGSTGHRTAVLVLWRQDAAPLVQQFADAMVRSFAPLPQAPGSHPPAG
ncbi:MULTISPECIES: LysR family transcriptional regulator [unclassified Acidovorax]|uniref:LysR family transcriptional regulator n=1 Tax=unclassified Acidovorax TaxID=2684926 RepID=UPI001C475A95|nr:MULTISPECIES: LysR family transcriptional regulator [unclassified Acidovorax]MBV7426613.1 LysR family transcriptional regulator [Acidovorax sp. sif0732]MBV7447738.1 LysR family transcriptional regulator [Acidovorax sp. sif0715]